MKRVIIGSRYREYAWYRTVAVLLLGVFFTLGTLHLSMSFADADDKSVGNPTTTAQSIKTGWFALDSDHNKVDGNIYDITGKDDFHLVAYISDGQIEVPAADFDIYYLDGGSGVVQVLIASKDGSDYKDAFLTSYSVIGASSQNNLITVKETFENSETLPPVTQEDVIRREIKDRTVSSDPVLSTQSDSNLGYTIVEQAKKVAADPNVGYCYSYKGSGFSTERENDVICFSFVNTVLRASGFGYSMPLRTNFAEQQQALEQLGFTRHAFNGFDDPSLTPGSILYNYEDVAHTSHVEIYMGRYSTTTRDISGNPIIDSSGQPLSIGAKSVDRATTELTYSLGREDFCISDPNDKGMDPGDQYQPSLGNWWVGEVSAGRADFCMGNTWPGKGSWGYYYAPPTPDDGVSNSNQPYGYMKLGKAAGENQGECVRELLSHWEKTFNTTKSLSEWIDFNEFIYCSNADYTRFKEIQQDAASFLAKRLACNNETAFFISASRPIAAFEANYTYNPDTQDMVIEITRVRPNYVTPEGKETTLAKANENHLAYLRKVNEVALLARQQAHDNINKVKFVHDYLITHCDYNYPAADANYLVDDRTPWNSYGALVLGQPVCAGYAAAAKVVLEKLGIPCQYVVSKNSDPDGNFHAWNRVYVDGNWYNMDVTWDDGTSSDCETKWFCKSDDCFVSQAKNSNVSDYYHVAWFEDWYGPDCSDECVRSASKLYDIRSYDSWTRYERMSILDLFDNGYSGFAGSTAKARWDCHFAYTGSLYKPGFGLARYIETSYHGKDDIRLFWIRNSDSSDLEVEYENNKDAGTASVTITGIGAYTGSTTKTFTIDIATLPETCPSITTISWSNNTNMFSIKELEEAIGYPADDLSWSCKGDTTNVGTISVTVKGTGKNVKGTTLTSFEIVPSDIALFANASNYPIPDQKYTGKACKPVVSFTPYGIVAAHFDSQNNVAYAPTPRKVVLNKDFTVTYKNNVHVGKAEAVITGIGNCYGSVKRTFNIVKGDSNFTVKLADTSTFEMRSSLNDFYIPLNRRFEISTIPNSMNSYEILSGNGAFTINSSTGDVKVRSNVAKGTYPVTIKVTNSGNNDYEPSSATVDLKINIVDSEPIIDRFYGNNAYDTMEQIVKQDAWEGFLDKDSNRMPVVVLATSEGYWDALSACGIAGVFKAPIIMVTKDTCPAQSKRLLKKIDPKYIFVIGGTAAITEQAVNQAKLCCSKGQNVPTYRYSGDNAAGTSLAVLKAHSGSSPWSSTAFICTDNGYWDAMSAAPISYANAMPIILTQNCGSELHSRTISYMKEEGITKVYIVGGTAAVKPAVEKQLKSAGIQIIKRLAGADAIDTSYKVAELGITELNMRAENVGIATSAGYWDALAGAAYCGSRRSVLVLVNDPTSSTATTFMKKLYSVFSGGVPFGYITACQGVVAIFHFTKPQVAQRKNGGLFPNLNPIIL